MSNETTVPASKSKALEDFKKSVEEDKITDNKKKELQEKKLFVESYRYTNELEKIKKNEEDILRAEKANVGVMSEEKIIQIQKENRDYLNNLNNSLIFLTPGLSKLVNAWPGNLILVGAATGGGKSSLTANLVISTIRQKNPDTDKNRSVLVISNEETPFSVYNRLTCLNMGWSYSDQNNFTQEQKETLIEWVRKWAQAGITVIENDGHGLTTSLEGIQSITANLFKTKTYYDMVIVDYIQKITESKRQGMSEWQVLKAVMNHLDECKNNYPGVFVVTSQLTTQTKDGHDNEREFQDRIRGGKDILNPCTMGIELIPDRELLRSRFVIRKNRYRGEVTGYTWDMGFKDGKFIPYTDEFKAEVAKRRIKEDYQKNIGNLIDDKPEEKKE